MKTLFTILFLFLSFSIYAQVSCGTVTEPFDISDSAEVARKAPFKFDSAESLMYLKRRGYNLKEDYLEKLKKETPDIYEKFKAKEIAEIQQKVKAPKQDQGLKQMATSQLVAADANGLKYIEVRFWRHLDYYTYAPYVSDATFQANITAAINRLNNNYTTNNIPLRFYASCNSSTFSTNLYNRSTRQISKSDAAKFIDGIPAYSSGLDVFYFDGEIMGDNGSINFAVFPWNKRNYSIAATNWGLTSSTITHEVGHALGLRHTHDNARGDFTSNNRTASGCYQESVSRVRKNYWYNGCTGEDNRLKCEINGDQIADTHASIEELGDYIVGGVYNNGAGTDNWGDSWTPPVRNYMSYVKGNPRTEFTPMQIAAILKWAEGRTTASYVSIAGDARLCPGKTGTYSVSVAGVTGYTWAVPAGFSIVSGQGTSTVTVTNNSANSGGVIEVAFAGCGAFGASKNISGNLGSYYVIGNDMVYPRSIETYSVSNANEPGITYSWTKPLNTSTMDGTTGSSITLSFSSAFTGGYLSVKETSVCGTSSRSIYIQPSQDPMLQQSESMLMSAGDAAPGKPYTVYPNPTNGRLTIECFAEEGYLMQLSSMDSKVQAEELIRYGENQFDFSNYAAGMYLLKIVASDKTVYTEKIIIK